MRICECVAVHRAVHPAAHRQSAYANHNNSMAGTCDRAAQVRDDIVTLTTSVTDCVGIKPESCMVSDFCQFCGGAW